MSTGPDRAPAGGDRQPPEGVRTLRAPAVGATTVVLVRHGEAVCGVRGVVGGAVGCTGLTPKGREQVSALADRLTRTGELPGVAALYASVLPRALETAEILAPALERWRDGPPLAVITDCDLCELHPGEADGLTWPEFLARYEEPNWDTDPTRPLAPGAESWCGFVDRASAAVTRVADDHPGETVVVACHAGVIESTLLRFLPMANPCIRLGLRTENASLTIWEHSDTWLLRRYNDVTVPPARSEDVPQQA